MQRSIRAWVESLCSPLLFSFLLVSPKADSRTIELSASYRQRGMLLAAETGGSKGLVLSGAVGCRQRGERSQWEMGTRGRKVQTAVAMGVAGLGGMRDRQARLCQ